MDYHHVLVTDFSDFDILRQSLVFIILSLVLLSILRTLALHYNYEINAEKLTSAAHPWFSLHRQSESLVVLELQDKLTVESCGFRPAADTRLGGLAIHDAVPAPETPPQVFIWLLKNRTPVNILCNTCLLRAMTLTRILFSHLRCHQAITWTNVGLSIRCSDFHLRAISLEILKASIIKTSLKITYLKFMKI